MLTHVGKGPFFEQMIMRFHKKKDFAARRPDQTSERPPELRLPSWLSQAEGEIEAGKLERVFSNEVASEEQKYPTIYDFLFISIANDPRFMVDLSSPAYLSVLSKMNSHLPLSQLFASVVMRPR